jgi:D-alanine-D-alanine ligase
MKKNIALVTGGYSGEAEISYKSAITVGNNIDETKYNVYKIDISNKGWFYTVNDEIAATVNRDNFTVIVNNETITFDVALLCIHGTPGEDGKLQGYFDMLGIPYTSCDAATSALTFNKRYTVAVAAFAGIHVAKSMHLFKHTPIVDTEILQQLQLPVFVKPNNGGSSIGMSKVNTSQELAPAIAKAFKEDNQILIEEFIQGREFTVGVYRNNNQITVLPITEIITKKEFFDFEAKYKGLSEEITPAILTATQLKDLQEAATKVYQVFNCRGVVRIDFIINNNNNNPYMLEINTVPGQSAASVIPQQVKAAGLTLKDFYSSIIDAAFTY